MHFLKIIKCKNPNDFPHFFWKQACSPFSSYFPVRHWPLRFPVRPGAAAQPDPPGRHSCPLRTTQPHAQAGALSAQDKGKLRFSGLIARMPAKGRDRDFFVPTPSASVPGERLITNLALCGQPWLMLFAQVAELTKAKSGILGDFGQ